MKLKLDENWTTTNNGYPLNDSEVERYNAVVPSEKQLLHAQKPFYAFIHFGMNTATGREWGNATETRADFNITKIKPSQWVKTIKSSGATGIILTCKHHDGFCLWNTAKTDFNVMNTELHTDIVEAVSKECKKQGMDFGVYLSPWDMHEKTYATDEYNDYFCAQLTELLTNYGEIFEVWFDGAKGAEAKAFDYDWERYYNVVHNLMFNNINDVYSKFSSAYNTNTLANSFNSIGSLSTLEINKRRSAIESSLSLKVMYILLVVVNAYCYVRDLMP